MILLLDHDDSFVFTLARYVSELGAVPAVVSARTMSTAAVKAMQPERVILSPGPRTPRDCPVAIDIIRELGGTIPILGVCLGHQCIATAYGGDVQPTPYLRHGRTSTITHDGRGVFAGVPQSFRGARYHSLAVMAGALPDALEVTAFADDGEVMGIRHRSNPVEGVQFHPESVLTEWGYLLLANFLRMPPVTVQYADGM